MILTAGGAVKEINVLLWYEVDSVDFGQKEKDLHGNDREDHGCRQARCLHCVIGGCKVGGQEGQPHEHCGVDAEHDELGLVEVVGQAACLEGADGAYHHQQQVEAGAEREAHCRV